MPTVKYQKGKGVIGDFGRTLKQKFSRNRNRKGNKELEQAKLNLEKLPKNPLYISSVPNTSSSNISSFANPLYRIVPNNQSTRLHKNPLSVNKTTINQHQQNEPEYEEVLTRDQKYLNEHKKSLNIFLINLNVFYESLETLSHIIFSVSENINKNEINDTITKIKQISTIFANKINDLKKLLDPTENVNNTIYEQISPNDVKDIFSTQQGKQPIYTEMLSPKSERGESNYNMPLSIENRGIYSSPKLYQNVGNIKIIPEQEELYSRLLPGKTKEKQNEGVYVDLNEYNKQKPKPNKPRKSGREPAPLPAEQSGGFTRKLKKHSKNKRLSKKNKQKTH